MYSNPYYSDSFDEYQARQRQQKLEQNSQPETPQIGGSALSGGSKGIGANIGNGIAIAGAGLDTFNQARNDSDGLALDKNAGLNGAVKGAAAGSAAGPWGTLIGAVVGTVAGQAGALSKINKNLKNVNVNPDFIGGTDSNGRPIYNSGAAFNSANTLSTINESQKNIHGSADITGTRWLANLAFGTNKKLKRKRDELRAGIQKSQNNFNNADITSINQQNNMEEYNKRLNNQSRINNLYSIPRTYQQMF